MSLSPRARLARLQRDAEKLAARMREQGTDADWTGRELEFMRDGLGLVTRAGKLSLWEGQRAIVEALLQHRRVTVRSARKGGKTFTAAAIVSAFMQCEPTIAITTAPTHRQVERLLWGHIRDLHTKAPRKLRGELSRKALDIGPTEYALGFATNETDRFQGFHGGVDVPDDPDESLPLGIADDIGAKLAKVEEAVRHTGSRILFVFDEAPGIPQEIFDAVKGSLIGERAYALMLGNPTISQHEPHEFALSHQPGSRYYRIRISAREAEDTLDCDASFVVPHWLAKPGELEAEYGPEHPLHKPYVLGQFADGDLSGRVVPFEYLIGAQEPCESNLPRGPHVGFDTAWKGDDKNVAVLYVDSVKVSEDSWHSMDTLATWERLKRLRLYWQERIGREIPWPNVHMDDAPVAAGIQDTARRERCSIHCVSFGSEPSGAWRDLNGDVRFKNRRAEMYWTLRELLRTKRACIPKKYVESWQELGAHTYSFTSGTNLLVIEPKEKVRERLGRSPDHADADVLAFSRSPTVAVARVG